MIHSPLHAPSQRGRKRDLASSNTTLPPGSIVAHPRRPIHGLKQARSHVNGVSGSSDVPHVLGDGQLDGDGRNHLLGIVGSKLGVE